MSPLIGSPPVAITVDVYRGACDASAAVALDRSTFAVADDEDPQNALRIYRFGQPNPISVIPTSSFLDAEGEVDIEGAEKLGDQLDWLTFANVEGPCAVKSHVTARPDALFGVIP